MLPFVRQNLLPFALSLFACFCVAGCDKKAETSPKPDADPALSGALGDQIMVDPDLVAQNRANQAASIPDGDGTVPTLDAGPEAIARARAAALTAVGGPGKMLKAPEPRNIPGSLPADATLTAATRAAAAPGGGTNCAEQVKYSASWAAKLPATFPVYPRGAVQEAAGTDEGLCSLRVVNFQTPVPLGEVVDFYYTRASNAGFSTQHALQDEDDVLGGLRGGASYVVYARKLPTGVTEVDLVTNGL